VIELAERYTAEGFSALIERETDHVELKRWDELGFSIGHDQDEGSEVFRPTFLISSSSCLLVESQSKPAVLLPRRLDH
jgi:hypothetical protein